MADSDRKPRDIKNLKARLGRTVTPNQAGKPVSAPPPGAGSVPPAAGAGSWPPPVAGKGSRPPAAFGSKPPSSAAGFPAPGSGVAIPKPGSGKAAAPSGIVAPPFVQQQQQQQQQAKAAAPASADPFAQKGTPQVQEKKVTLVLDDSAVSESEIGKKSRIKNLIILGFGAIVGVALGFMVGNTAGDREMWEVVIQDTKALYKQVNEVSKTVEEAKTHIQTLYTASQGGPGSQARVDYSAIESLVALKRPLSANAFHRKRYMAFNAGTVDDLFDYYNNINILWDKFTALGAKTAGKKKREILDQSAKSADALLNDQYSLIPFLQGEAISGGIVIVDIPQIDESKKDDPEEQFKLLVSTRKGGNQVERQRFAGQKEFLENPSGYVIMINKARSMGILGRSANLFGEFRGDVTEMNNIMTKTMEVQGRLIKTMGEIAAKY